MVRSTASQNRQTDQDLQPNQEEVALPVHMMCFFDNGFVRLPCRASSGMHNGKML